jgi:hypothetical protein
MEVGMTLIDELKNERLKQLDEAQRINEIIFHLEELLKLLGEPDPVPPPAMTIDDRIREENKRFGGDELAPVVNVASGAELDSFLSNYHFYRVPGQTDEEYRAAFSDYINSSTAKVLRPSKPCPLCYTFDTHQPGCEAFGLGDRAAKKVEEIARKDIMRPYDKNDTRDTPIS